MGRLPLNLLTFPLWWYSTGVSLMWAWSKRQFSLGIHHTGLTLFARHLGEPLYGDYTRAGRIIGFFLRIILLVIKLLMLSARLIMVLLLDLIFLAILPASLAFVIYQLSI